MPSFEFRRLIRSDAATGYASSLLISQMIGVLRMVIVARVLGDAIQGQVIVLGMVVSFFSTIIVLNSAWQLVQSDHFDQPGFQSSLQGMACARGLMTAITIAIFGSWVLGRLQMPELRDPLFVLALIPVLEGFVHLDAWRGLRSKSFRKIGIIEVASPLASLVVAMGTLVFLRSVWVFVFASLAASAGRMLASHLVADRGYSIRISGDYIREILRFTLPLIPAGMFFWLNGQSDRIVLLFTEGSGDLAMLGAYGTVAMICVLPLNPISKLVRSIVVPQLAEVKHEKTELRRRFRGVLIRIATGVCIVILVAGIAAAPVLEIVLGPEFRIGTVLAPILVSAVGLQFVRIVGYQLGVASGDTRVQLVGNLIRLSGIPFAVLAMEWSLGLEGLALSVVLAELCALMVVSIWLGRTIVPVTGMMLVGTGLVVSVFLAALAADRTLGSLDPWIRSSAGVGILVVMVIVFAVGKGSETLGGNRDSKETVD